MVAVKAPHIIQGMISYGHAQKDKTSRCLRKLLLTRKHSSKIEKSAL
jgi:hypothetical protein